MAQTGDVWQSGDVTLYCADCRDIIPTLKGVDVVVTDPPFGLGNLSGTTSKLRNRNAYSSTPDTEEYIATVVVPAIRDAMSLAAGRGLVTCGVRCMWLYDRPRAVGGFYQPAAVGMSPWGFAGFNPVLYYGKDPRDGKGQCSVMTKLTERASCKEHPCSKPLGAMMWLVNKGSTNAETVLDPFMGSGTTGVACVRLGRKFIGIEIDPGYFEIAKRRIREAQKETALFDAPPKPKQATLTEGC